MFQLPYYFEILLFASTIFISIAYVILLSKIMDGWDDTPEWDIPKGFTPQKKVTVVIAARNEEQHIVACLESIANCTYPESLYEIILVDDHSKDKTVELAQNLNLSNLSILRLDNTTGKKSALSHGIHNATGSIIACTDADSTVPKQWLMSFGSMFETNSPKCIAGPISYQTDKTLLQRFQYLDALNNMCVTANGIQKKSYYMANGANLFFTKSAFESIGGYANHTTLASGDDMFLIQEMAQKYPKGIAYLKSSNGTVKTQPETSFTNLKNQRIRWATKSKAYQNKNILWIQGFVFCFVLLILLNLILSPFSSGLTLFGFLFALFIKWTIDYLYLSKMADFFGDRDPLKSFFGASIGFIFYIIFAGWMAILPRNYTWKGRVTK